MNRKIVLAVLLALGAALLGATLALKASSSPEQPPSALSRARVAGDALPVQAAAAATNRGLAVAASRRVAPGIYLLPSSDGSQTCLLSLVGNEMRGSCNSEGNFFAGKQLVFSIAEGGAPTQLTALSVNGVARPGVATVRATFPNGLVREVTPTVDGGFSIVADAAALAAGEPTKIEAVNAGGHVIDSQPGPAN